MKWPLLIKKVVNRELRQKQVLSLSLKRGGKGSSRKDDGGGVSSSPLITARWPCRRLSAIGPPRLQSFIPLSVT